MFKKPSVPARDAELRAQRLASEPFDLTLFRRTFWRQCPEVIITARLFPFWYSQPIGWGISNLLSAIPFSVEEQDGTICENAHVWARSFPVRLSMAPISVRLEHLGDSEPVLAWEIRGFLRTAISRTAIRLWLPASRERLPRGDLSGL